MRREREKKKRKNIPRRCVIKMSKLPAPATPSPPPRPRQGCPSRAVRPGVPIGHSESPELATAQHHRAKPISEESRKVAQHRSLSAQHRSLSAQRRSYAAAVVARQWWHGGGGGTVVAARWWCCRMRAGEAGGQNNDVDASVLTRHRHRTDDAQTQHSTDTERCRRHCTKPVDVGGRPARTSPA